MRPRWTMGCVLVLLAVSSQPTAQVAAPAAAVTVFEGARLIVGDGTAPVEDESSSFNKAGSVRSVAAG